MKETGIARGAVRSGRLLYVAAGGRLTVTRMRLGLASSVMLIWIGENGKLLDVSPRAMKGCFVCRDISTGYT